MSARALIKGLGVAILPASINSNQVIVGCEADEKVRAMVKMRDSINLPCVKLYCGLNQRLVSTLALPSLALNRFVLSVGIIYSQILIQARSTT